MSSHSHGSAPHDPAKHPHRHRALSLGAARSRDEARLGITTDYKDLSLHSAAANGNLGLVQYALSHGQPVNSVLNGVLPLHAAASSGNDTIVRMLIEAGADVNSPRLSRRYTREGSKSSGISVGSQGSTPLHFAAANGHLSVLVLLLSFGADPRVPEKHGLTPAQMAATNGHRDAAALLHTRANQMDDTDEAGSQASSRSGGGGGGSTGRPPSVRSSLSMTRRSSRGGVSAQRSFDALATKLAHASHTTPLHAFGLASNSSLHSLASLASSATGHSPHLGSGSPASSSQISLGAVSGAGAAGLAGPVTRQRSRPDGGAGSTTRRPSLPSVWEKAAHPRAALRQAFGRSSGAAGAAGRRPSDASVLSEEDGERSGEDGDGAEYAEHRRSLEVHRPLRRDSYQGLAPGGVERAMDPIEDEDDEDDVPTPVQTRAPQLPLVPPQQPPSPVGTLARAASHQFYRPRQSSQLSRSSFGDGHSSFDADSSVFHDDNEGTPSTVPSSPPTAPSGAVAAANSAPTSPTSPRRARATSNPGPQTGARSPLLQQVQLSQQQQQHFHQLQVQLRRSREESGPIGTIGDGVVGGGSTASSRPSTSGSGAADGESSSSAENEDGGAPYSGAGGPRARGLPSFDVRRTFLDPAAASAFSSASPSPSLQATAAQQRARSNSASTDGSLAARSSYSFAPSTSTAPTSVGTPSSSGGANAAGRHGHAHGHHGKEAAITSVPQGRYLAPVYELRAPPSPSRPGAAATSEDDEPKTQAQARSRVQRAERELLALAHEAGASSTKAGSNGSGHGSSGSRATSQRSLKDQLAAYGKSLKAEKELVERDERERRAGNGARKEAPVAPGFTFETISKSTAASTSPSSSAPTTPTPTSVPSWRAIPPVDRLGPPSAVAHGRRSVSPSATSSSAATTTHRRRPSQELDTVLVPAKAASPRSAHHHHHHGADGGAAVPAPARAASPTSTRSGSAKSSSTTTAAAAAASASVPAVAPVLGQGHGGVSFVGVAPKPAAPTTSSPLAGPPHSHAHHHHHHHHHPGAQPRTSRSDKSHSERGGAAVAGARKTRDQVEEDRREKAHLEERVPKAVRTVPSERKGFKRWFGSSSAAGAAGASAGKGESAERRS